MTSLRKRVENVLAELDIIREAISESKHYPPCCLTVQEDGKISCDSIGPLPRKVFLEECRKCQELIKRILSKINIEETNL